MRPYHWSGAFVSLDVMALVIAPLWTMMAVTSHRVWGRSLGEQELLLVRGVLRSAWAA